MPGNGDMLWINGADGLCWVSGFEWTFIVAPPRRTPGASAWIAPTAAQA